MPSRPDRRTSVLSCVLAVCVLSLLAFGCETSPGASGDASDWRPLAPGGEVEGPGGARLVAPEGALDDTVDVELTAAELPELALEDGLSPVGPPVALVARARAGTVNGEPFVLELPVPDGLDPDTAGVSVHLSGGESGFHDDAGRPLDDPLWDTVELELDESGRFARLELSVLSAMPAVVQIVDGADFVASEPLAPQDHGMGFVIVCRRRHQDVCDAYANDARAALNAAHTRFSDMGFPEPFLRTYRDGAYKVHLKPYKLADGNGTCKVDTSLRGRTGRYNFPLRKLTVCVGGGPFPGVTADDGWTAGRTRTTFHELFHAVQYSYGAIRVHPMQMWSMEGTANLSESSTATTLTRDTSDPRPVDVPLDLNFILNPGASDSNQYRTQDFWAYLGDVIAAGEGLAYLIDVFRSGPTPPEVSSAIAGFGHVALHDLSDAYWAWARNQTFEKTVLSDTRGTAPDHPAEPACQLLPDVATPHTIVLDDGTSSASHAATLPPLTSAIVEIVVVADGPLDEELVYTTALNGSGLRAALYDPNDCLNPDIGADGLFQVPAGTTGTRYLLVSNTEFRQGRRRDFTFELSFGQVEPGVAIVSPSDGATATEGDTFTLRAEGVDGILPDDALLHWTYERWDGVPFTIATERADTPVQTPVLCDRTVPIQVEVWDGPAAMVGATDTIDVIIEDADPREPPCDWSVEITWPPDGSTIPVGETVHLQSVFDDDHPETDERLEDIGWWYAATGGDFIAPIIILDLGPYDADRFMTFDDPGTYRIGVTYGDASDTVDVVVDEGSPPSVTMTAPPATATYEYDDDGYLCTGIYCLDVPVSATATDDEDGTLSGAQVVWSVEDPIGSGVWTEVATGTTGEITLRFDAPNKTVSLRVRGTDSAGMTDEDFATLTLIGPAN
jgi:hypothetical protein